MGVSVLGKKCLCHGKNVFRCRDAKKDLLSVNQRENSDETNDESVRLAYCIHAPHLHHHYRRGESVGIKMSKHLLEKR
jgi:hypothetical protein